jgi:hypothetical protein
VQRHRANAPDAPWSVSVRVRGEGDGGREEETAIAVVRGRTLPGSYAQAATALGELAGADVAALTLARAAAAAPLDLGPAPRPGDAMIAAGFGLDERGADGVLRAATTRVRAVSGDVASTDPVTCDGDSGGPLLDRDGAVVGVLSGAVGACGAGESRYTLAGAAAALVAAARCESGDGCPHGGDASLTRDDLGAPGASPSCGVSSVGGRRRGPAPRVCGGICLLGIALARRRRRTTRPRRASASGRAPSLTTTGGLG